MTTKTPNGFEYLIAVLNMRPFKRPATHHVLIMLTKFRNSKTGLCCPSVKRLMECTGFAKRTILLELAELRQSGVLTHKKGWGNDHARGIPNRYTLSLSTIKGLALAGAVVAPSNEAGAKDDEAGATGNEAGATDGTYLTKQVQLSHQAGASTAPLTMKVIMEQGHNSEEKTNCEGENGEGADGSEKCDQEVFEEPVGPDSLTKPPQAAKSDQEVFEETEEAFDNPQNPTSLTAQHPASTGAPAKVPTKCSCGKKADLEFSAMIHKFLPQYLPGVRWCGTDGCVHSKHASKEAAYAQEIQSEEMEVM